MLSNVSDSCQVRCLCNQLVVYELPNYLLLRCQFKKKGPIPLSYLFLKLKFWKKLLSSVGGREGREGPMNLKVKVGGG